jgi:hypothetical protein
VEALRVASPVRVRLELLFSGICSEPRCRKPGVRPIKDFAHPFLTISARSFVLMWSSSVKIGISCNRLLSAVLVLSLRFGFFAPMQVILVATSRLGRFGRAQGLQVENCD